MRPFWRKKPPLVKWRIAAIGHEESHSHIGWTDRAPFTHTHPYNSVWHHHDWGHEGFVPPVLRVHAGRMVIWCEQDGQVVPIAEEVPDRKIFEVMLVVAQGHGPETQNAATTFFWSEDGEPLIWVYQQQLVEKELMMKFNRVDLDRRWTCRILREDTAFT